MTIQRKLDQIDTLFIHCSATPNGRFHDAADIDQWHGDDRLKNGQRPFNRSSPLAAHHAPYFKHIGYHLVITTHGDIELGRHLEEVGAHAYKHNINSIGLCLVGMDRFTPEQWFSLKLVVKGLQSRIPSLKFIRAHHEVAPHKTCPGYSVADWLANDMEPLPEHILTLEENS